MVRVVCEYLDHSLKRRNTLNNNQLPINLTELDEQSVKEEEKIQLDRKSQLTDILIGTMKQFLI